MIDVIVATYNRSRMLDLTLSSILRQSMDPSQLCVVVADDGSSDDTKAVVESYRGRLPVKYLYQEDRGYRVASARNMGLSHCNGDICLFVDAGIVLESNCLKTHLEFHRQIGQPACAIGYIYGFDDKDPSLCELEELSEKAADTDSLIGYFEATGTYLDPREKEYRLFEGRIDHLPAPWAFFWTGHVSVHRKHLWTEVFFDTIFEPRYGFEDIDLGYRLHQKNAGIYLLKEAKSFHYPHRKRENFSRDNKANSVIFRQKYQSELAELFYSHGGTFGFNELLLSMKSKNSNKNTHESTILPKGA